MKNPKCITCKNPMGKYWEGITTKYRCINDNCIKQDFINNLPAKVLKK